MQDERALSLAQPSASGALSSSAPPEAVQCAAALAESPAPESSTMEILAFGFKVIYRSNKGNIG